MPSGQRPIPFSGMHAASPNKRSSTTTTTNISAALQSSIPTCARPCFSTYIDQEYTCSGNDASCLCEQYSSEGFTLGELAFLCIRLDCSSPTTKQETEAYNICAARPSAVHATHSTLTLPATSSMPMQTPASSTIITRETVTTTSSTTPTAAVSAESAASGFSPTLSPTPSAADSTASAKSGGSSSLTGAQAIGISVAAIGAVTFAVAVAYIVTCMRKRKAKRVEAVTDSYDFVDEEGPNGLSFNHWTAEPRNPPLSGYHQPVMGAAEKHNTAWPSQYPQTIRLIQPHEQDATRQYQEPISTLNGFYQSRNEPRVPSQLLPDRPNSRPPPPPPKSPIQYPQTPATIFEEERTPPIPPVLLPGLPAHPAVHKTRPLSAQPVLSLSIPGQAHCQDTTKSVDSFSLPAPPTFPTRSSSRSNDLSSRNSLLDYYASPDSGSPGDLYSSTPIDSGTQVRRPPPAAILVTKPTYPPQAVRVSMASTDSRRTSFESIDPDEPTPPEEEDKRLTPVAESPIAGIRYPKIPRSSNQSVPRSPGGRLSPRSAADFEECQYTSPRYERRAEKPPPRTPEHQKRGQYSPTLALSGTTLAAKRRGDNAAQALEHSIHIADSAYASNTRKNYNKTSTTPKGGQETRAHRHESPLKGYGRVASRQQSHWPLTLEMKTPGSQPSLKSPLWEPKLTPSRMGDDLYLSVSAATPQRAHFGRLYNAR